MDHHDVDCPTCFVGHGDEGIRQEYGDRGHHGAHGAHGHGRRGFHGHGDMLGAHKPDVGEALIGDHGPIQHGEGHHGLGHETYRHIDFHELFRKPSAHHYDHYETSDHHRRHEYEDEHDDEHYDEHEDDHEDEHDDEHYDEHYDDHDEEVEIDGIPEENAQPAKAAKGKKGAQADPSMEF